MRNPAVAPTSPMNMEYVVRSPPVCSGRTGNWKATFDEKWNRIARPTAPPLALNNAVMITLNPATQRPNSQNGVSRVTPVSIRDGA